MTNRTSEAYLTARRAMPQLDGAIVDPQYVPEHRRAAYLAEWGKYLRATPRAQWEPWMKDMIAAAKRQRGEP